MIAIIGAGIAGLTCAHIINSGGHDVCVFDKGRGLGGRIATRQTDFGSFDHGAQYATAHGLPFKQYLSRLKRGEQVKRWDVASGETDRWVAVPGMSALVRPLAEGLTVHRNTHITELERAGQGWMLRDTGGVVYGPYDGLVLTPPAPQSLDLLGQYADCFPELRTIRYSPCWTLLAAFNSPLQATPLTRSTNGIFGWIAKNSSKPGRDGTTETWVAQVNSDWSQQELELDKNEMSGKLLAHLFEQLSLPVRSTVYTAAHRWRYARVEHPAGQAFAYDDDLKIGLAGDGMLGGRIEAAYESGRLLALHLLEGLHSEKGFA